MKLLKISVLLLLVTFVACDKHHPFGNKQEKMESLEGIWYLQKYEIDGLEAELTEQEESNYLQLKSGKLFECLENGKAVEGNWNYRARSETISLMEGGVRECIDYDIIESTENLLVYEKKTEESTKMKVWMTSIPRSTEPVSLD
ncbi:MAG: hypothetical protein ACI85F_000492 [Bacteroidia bacterium]|jgi:hypothetical protein